MERGQAMKWVMVTAVLVLYNYVLKLRLRQHLARRQRPEHTL